MVHASRPGVQVLGRHGGSAERGVPCSLPVLMGHVIVAHSPMMQETHGEKPLRLALIGMSGSGKTFWTKRLAEAGRPSISSDDQIEQRLVPSLPFPRFSPTTPAAALTGLSLPPTHT